MDTIYHYDGVTGLLLSQSMADAGLQRYQGILQL